MQRTEITVSATDLRLAFWEPCDKPLGENEPTLSPIHIRFIGTTPSGDEFILRIAGRRAGAARSVLYQNGMKHPDAISIKTDSGVMGPAERSAFLDLLGWRVFRAHQRDRLQFASIRGLR